MVKRDPPRGHCWAGGGLFAVTVIRDYGRTAAARQTLLEKGSVLIRALRIRLARRNGDAHASCAAAGLTGREWPGSLEYVGLRSRMNKEQS